MIQKGGLLSTRDLRGTVALNYLTQQLPSLEFLHRTIEEASSFAHPRPSTRQVARRLALLCLDKTSIFVFPPFESANIRSA